MVLVVLELRLGSRDSSCMVDVGGGFVVTSGTENVPLTTLLVVTTDTMASPMRIEPPSRRSPPVSGSTFSDDGVSGEIDVADNSECSSSASARSSL